LRRPRRLGRPLSPAPVEPGLPKSVSSLQHLLHLGCLLYLVLRYLQRVALDFDYLVGIIEVCPHVTKNPTSMLLLGNTSVPLERIGGRRGLEPVNRVEWLGEQAGEGCVERSFLLRRRGEPVPGVLWSPASAAPQATVLLLHGGSGHKRSERHVRMGRRLASAAGVAVIAIDGPHHGDRVRAPVAPSVYQQMIADEGIECVTARMTADWLETISALAALGLAEEAHISVFGMSMGTRFGLPVAAALGPRLRCAVLGKFGIRQASPLHPGLCAPGLMVAAARAVSAPVLYHVQWDDAIFPRDGQFELFDALASVGKRLTASPGPHGLTHPDDEASWQGFIEANTPPNSPPSA
jgi:pimeloyl-ACP methyl ester carboxylesterase